MDDESVRVSPEIFKDIRAYADGEHDPEVFERILRSYFAGKRDAVRTYRLMNIEIIGKRGLFDAVAVDISRSGILLRIQDPSFAREQELDQIMPYTARVWYHFEGGFEIVFPDEGKVRVQADVVRVTGYVGRGERLIFVGCRFRRTLESDECERLGIEHGDDRSPAE
jgi:hypothetical protein